MKQRKTGVGERGVCVRVCVCVCVCVCVFKVSLRVCCAVKDSPRPKKGLAKGGALSPGNILPDKGLFFTPGGLYVPEIYAGDPGPHGIG